VVQAAGTRTVLRWLSGTSETLFRLMLATGLRRAEALALHWSDVDLDAGC
jgi:integrase